jgi:DNA-binding NarL/FixJ family response regulator
LLTFNQHIEDVMQFETEFYAAGGRPTIFLIEPEQVVRSALYYILRDRYRTRAFASLDEATGSTMETPDVLLLGLAILRSRGEALLAELGEQFGPARILLVADSKSDPLAEASLERGAHGIISKPISFDSVSDAVSMALAGPVFSGEPSRLIRVSFG